jgi:type I restriction enzyme R subunit
MELVKQVQINIPYILQLVKQFHDKNCQDKTIIAKIQKAIGSSPDLRDKKDLIMQFIDRMTPSPDVHEVEEYEIDDEWTKYIQEQKEIELQNIIKEEKP